MKESKHSSHMVIILATLVLAPGVYQMIGGCGQTQSTGGPSAEEVAEVLKNDQSFLDSVQGPKGDKGDTGATGAKGDTGPQGPAGPGALIAFCESEPLQAANVTSSYQSFCEVTLPITTSGNVHIIGNASFEIAPNIPDLFFLGIATTDNGTPVNAASEAANNKSGTGSLIPATTQYVEHVDAGTKTYYLVAKGPDSCCSIVSVQLTATFYPD